MSTARRNMIMLWAGGCLFGVAVAIVADGSGGGLGMPGTIGIVGVVLSAVAIHQLFKVVS